MTNQALLLKTKDRRQFLTSEKNLPLLAEFVKTFSVDVALVKVSNETKLLELDTLAPAICDANYSEQCPEYEMVEKILPKEKTPVQKTESASTVRAFIRSKLMNHEELSLSDLREEYGDLGNSALCSQYSQVRKMLQAEGFTISKTGAGRYKID